MHSIPRYEGRYFPLIDFKSFSEDDLKRWLLGKLQKHDVKAMQEGEDYYCDKQDILLKRRTAIGENGARVDIVNLPNTIIVDNQYAKLVDQKVGYLFSSLPDISAKSKSYQKKLVEFFDKRMMRTLSKVAKDSFNCGIGWVFVYPDETGAELKVKRLDPKAVIPVWEDSSREKLNAVIYRRTEISFEDGKETTKEYVELYTDDGVMIFAHKEGNLELLDHVGYLKSAHGEWTWEKIPFVYFRYRDHEYNLLRRVKSLQDAINTILSNFGDMMLEDPRNTILILKGYDGTDLGDFRAQLAQYAAVKIVPEQGAGLEALTVEVNHENYSTILKLLKEKLIENGRGLDAKNDKSGQQPNELNIKSMYSDIELDANLIELEFAASFEYLQYFLRTLWGVSQEEVATITFKRNIMVNERETVEMIRSSVGLVSDKTLRSKHPLVENPEEEEKRIEAQEEEKLEKYGMIPHMGGEAHGEEEADE